MITNNFKKMMAFYPHIYDINDIYNLVNTSGNTVGNVLGSEDYGFVVSEGYSYGINATNVTRDYWRYNIFTGSGTTTPTASDYTLETPVLLTFNSGSVSVAGTSRIITHTLTNNTGSSVTINEVALTATRPQSSRFMLDRTVLANPVTIPDGSSYTFIYNLDFGNITLQQQ